VTSQHHIAQALDFTTVRKIPAEPTGAAKIFQFHCKTNILHSVFTLKSRIQVLVNCPFGFSLNNTEVKSMRIGIGIVSLQTGIVVATGSAGVSRVLHLGETIFEDDDIDLGADSTLEVKLYNGETLTFKQSLHQVLLSKYVTSDTSSHFDFLHTDAVASLTYHLDPYDFLNPSREHHSNFTFIVRSAQEIDPTAGFDPLSQSDSIRLEPGLLSDPAKAPPTTEASISGIFKNPHPASLHIINNGFSNDTSPVLRGILSQKLTAIEELVVLRNGIPIGKATLSNTTWNYQDSALETGHQYHYTVQVVSTDGRLSPLSAVYSINIDTIDPAQIINITDITDDIAPKIGSVADGDDSNDLAPKIIGTLSSSLGTGEVVNIYRDGTLLGKATTVGLTWSFNDSGLSDATSYNYTAQVIDLAGNIGGLSNSYNFNTDATAPMQTVIITDILDDILPSTGNLAHDDSSNDTTPELLGTLSTALAANEVLNILRDGVVIGQATVTGTNWRYTDSGLLDGNSYDYSAQIIDPASNLGPLSNLYTINIDTTAPTQTGNITDIQDNVAPLLGAILNNGFSNDLSPELNGTLNATLASGEVLNILRDGIIIGQATITGNNWSFNDSALVDGNSYSYTTQVSDAAGNLGPLSTSHTINIDTSSPTQVISITDINDDIAPNTGSVANGDYSNDLAPEIIGTLSNSLSAGEVLNIYRDGTLLGQATIAGLTWSFNDSGLSDATSYNYTAQVIDLAGNTGGLSNSYNFNTNATAPTQMVVITDILDDLLPSTNNLAHNDSSNDTTPELIGTLSTALAANEVLNILRDGVVIGQAIVTGTNWRYTDAGLLDGNSYDYSAQIIDAASNLGTLSNLYTINIDTTAPTQIGNITDIQDNVAPLLGAILNNGFSNDLSPELNGTLTAVLAAGEVLNILRDGVIIGQATITGNNWSFNDSALIDGNSYSYTTQVSDAAGNVGPLSTSHTINIDTSSPTQVISITDINDDIAPNTGSVANGDYSNDLAPEIIGTLSSSLSADELVNIYRDGTLLGQATITGLTWSFNDSGLSDATSYNYTAQVIDLAGNTGGLSNSYNFNTDTSTPTQTVIITDILDDLLPSTNNLAHNDSSNDTTPELIGTLSAALATNEVLNILRDGVVIGQAIVTGTNWRYTDSGLLDGNSYDYSAQINDAAGNLGTLSNLYTINIDTTAPTQIGNITDIQDNVAPLLGAILNNGFSNDLSPELNGTLTAALAAGEVLNILRDGVIIGQATITGNNWNFDDSALVDGNSYSYTTQVSDAAGNLGPLSTSHTINIDTSNPTQIISITDINDDIAPYTGSVADGGDSNDLAPEITGTLSSSLSTGEVVNIYRDGTLLGQATIAGLTWSFNDSGLSDATSYNYTAQIIDLAGNLGGLSNSYNFNTDTTAPTQTVTITDIQDDVTPITGTISNGGISNDDAPLLNGALSALLQVGESVQILRNSTVIGTATVTGLSWSFNDSALVDGNSYSYQAQVIDSAGNLAALSANYTVTIDTSAPTQTVNIINITDDVSPFLGPVGHNGTTNDTAPLLSGTLSSLLNAGELLDIIRDSTVIGQAIVTGLTWSFNDSALSNGTSYNYRAQVRDNSGNLGPLANTFTLNIDTLAPAQTVTITDILDNVLPSINNVAHNDSSNDTTPELIGTLSTALATNEVLNILRDGVVIGQAIVTGTNWRYTDAGLLDGNSYDYSAQIIDAASNLGTLSNLYTINIDTTAPTQTGNITDIQDNVAPLLGAILNNSFSNDLSPELNGTLTAALAAGEVLNILRDGVIIGQATITGNNWSFDDSALVDGNSYSYTTQVSDAAGNLGPLSTSHTINIDTSNPTQIISITDINDDIAPYTGSVADGGDSNDLAPEITGTLSSSLSTGEVVNIYRDGTLLGQATIAGLTWSFNDSGLSDATSYNYTAQIIDLAGNLGGLSNSYNFNTDTTAPTQTVTITDIQDNVAPITGTISNGGISNDNAPVLNGTLNAPLNTGEVVNILRFGVVIGQAIVTGTNWSYSDLGLVDGNNYIYNAQVADAAANLGVISASYAINIDTSSPVQTSNIVSIQDDLAPIISGIANGGITNDTSPLLNGTLSAILAAGEFLNVLRNGTVIGQAVVASTSWSFSDNALVDANTYTYTTQVIDAAGNSGVLSNAYSITIDTTAPSQVVTITDIQDDVAPNTGSIASGGSSNDLAPQLIGILDSGLAGSEVINILRDGVIVGQASVSGLNWTFNDIGLADQSSFTYTAVIVDGAGNTGTVSNSYNFNTDAVATAAPTLGTVQDNVGAGQGSLNNGATTDDAKPTVNVLLPAGAVAGDTLALYNGATLIGTHTITAGEITSGTASVEPSGNLTDATHTLSTAIIDAAGNRSPNSASISLTVDTYNEAAAFLAAVTAGAARWGGHGGSHITDPYVNVLALPAGSVVKLYVANNKVGETSISVDGWSAHLTVSGSFAVSSGQYVHATVTYNGVTRTVHTGHVFMNPGNTDISFSSPLILDLGGNGIETLNYSSGVLFDINADGKTEQTGWVGASDALLVLDLNQDGLINDASELFGEHMLKQDGSKASDGFDALAQYDSNQDGVIDNQDQIYSQLLLWVDSNSDGISQADELFTLEQRGITQLNLFSERVNQNNNGNLTALEGYYLDNDGNRQLLSDVWFSYIENNSAANQSDNLILDAADNVLAISEAIDKLQFSGIDISPLQSFDYLHYYNKDASISLDDLLESSSNSEINADSAAAIFRYVFTHYSANSLLSSDDDNLVSQTSETRPLYLQNLALFSTEQHQIIDALLAEVASES